MRLLSFIRSTLFGSFAMLACVLMFHAPASAAFSDDGYFSIEHQPDGLDLAIFDTVAIALAVKLDRLNEPGERIAFAQVEPPRPEYAESYDTHGLSLIDLRRRC